MFMSESVPSMIKLGGRAGKNSHGPTVQRKQTEFLNFNFYKVVLDP